MPWAVGCAQSDRRMIVDKLIELTVLTGQAFYPLLGHM
jgi:hypothetical protein